MRNFGRSIGSKGWMFEAQHHRGNKVAVCCVCVPRDTAAAAVTFPTWLLMSFEHCEQLTWNCCREGESNCLIET
eukprot:NODE_210_length_2467_cov_5539.148470_g5_i4.p9 GENE.NODE_210_length_2467_cov_5539.148470_g5_i4~~NODE_210_length_2467_cov_5539.148470_g5_i4.p9  ORF type:complete len:74 (-),score=0.23 NODE_210_length_2467_cov_5539.148470_g5_i4:140-361(-)